ncbi:hypothetical protein ABH926_008924 [Catenulispora sp. GP43]|uniref:hypothetical protein n=1 Tax=Catenulispora sp. GP43 TaxID=3156263 RepID=UPI003515106C
MSNTQIYTVSCRRCDTSQRVPGWESAAELAQRHADNGCPVNIRRLWLRTCAPVPAAA